MLSRKVNELNSLFKDLGLQANPQDKLLRDITKAFAPHCIFTLHIVHAELAVELSVSAMYRLFCIWLQEGLCSIHIDPSGSALQDNAVDTSPAFPCIVQSLYDRGLSLTHFESRIRLQCTQFEQIESFSWEILSTREYVSRAVVEAVMPAGMRPSYLVFGFPVLTFDFLQACRCVSQSVLLVARCSENIKNN